MKYLCYVICSGSFAAAVIGCSGPAADLDGGSQAQQSTPDTDKKGKSQEQQSAFHFPKPAGARVLLDEEYDKAKSKASTSQEQTAVASARRLDRDTLQKKPEQNEVMAMRKVLNESPSPQVRAVAAAGLGNALDIDSTPALLDAMEDDSLVVRESAFRALRKMLHWSEPYKADGPVEERQEIIHQYRSKWVTFQETDLYRMYKEPEFKEEKRRLAEKKWKAEQRRARHPKYRDQPQIQQPQRKRPRVPRPSKEDFLPDGTLRPDYFDQHK